MAMAKPFEDLLCFSPDLGDFPRSQEYPHNMGLDEMDSDSDSLPDDVTMERSFRRNKNRRELLYKTCGIEPAHTAEEGSGCNMDADYVTHDTIRNQIRRRRNFTRLKLDVLYDDLLEKQRAELMGYYKNDVAEPKNEIVVRPDNGIRLRLGSIYINEGPVSVTVPMMSQEQLINWLPPRSLTNTNLSTIVHYPVVKPRRRSGKQIKITDTSTPKRAVLTKSRADSSSSDDEEDFFRTMKCRNETPKTSKNTKIPKMSSNRRKITNVTAKLLNADVICNISTKKVTPGIRNLNTIGNVSPKEIANVTPRELNFDVIDNVPPREVTNVTPKLLNVGVIDGVSQKETQELEANKVTASIAMVTDEINNTNLDSLLNELQVSNIDQDQVGMWNEICDIFDEPSCNGIVYTDVRLSENPQINNQDQVVEHVFDKYEDIDIEMTLMSPSTPENVGRDVNEAETETIDTTNSTVIQSSYNTDIAENTIDTNSEAQELSSERSATNSSCSTKSSNTITGNGEDIHEPVNNGPETKKLTSNDHVDSDDDILQIDINDNEFDLY